jgi:hypothetical protein
MNAVKLVLLACEARADREGTLIPTSASQRHLRCPRLRSAASRTGLTPCISRALQRGYHAWPMYGDDAASHSEANVVATAGPFISSLFTSAHRPASQWNQAGGFACPSIPVIARRSVTLRSCSRQSETVILHRRSSRGPTPSVPSRNLSSKRERIIICWP